MASASRPRSALLWRPVTALAATFDQAFTGALTRRGPRRDPADHLAALRRIAEAYDDPPASFFDPGPAMVPSLNRVGSRAGDIEVQDATWPSPLRLAHPDPELATRYHRSLANRQAHARLFLQPDPGRPAMILVHGYRAGNPALEERLWPVRWFTRRGFDVALFTLPFHGVRRRERAHRFPHSDPRFTIEGFRHAIIDLRRLVAWLKSRGAPVVGAAGMSLGGYTVSLLGTVEALDVLVPFIPLASFADVAQEAGNLTGDAAAQREQHAAIAAAYGAVSPFTRLPRVPGHRVVVVAGEGDRITPIGHAERLAGHFRGELVRMPGGHLLQVGRRRGFEALEGMLRREGWLARR